jgi:hypothetical protein
VISFFLCVSASLQADDALKGSKQSDKSTRTVTKPAGASDNYTLFNKMPYDKLGDLTTDRPDFTESTETVEPGWIQYEFTIAQYGEDFDGVDGSSLTWSYGSSLFRVGLLPSWELRLGWDGYSNTRTNDSTGAEPTDTVGGGGDINIGFKNKFTSQEGWIPNTGILYGLSLPTGAANVTSETVDPSVKLLWSYDLTEKLAVSGNLNFNLVSADIVVMDATTATALAPDRDRHLQFEPTLSFGYSITDWWGVFVEYYLSHNMHDSIPDQQFFNSGFTFLIHKNLQLDMFTNIGLTKSAEDLAVGTGISWRF